MFARWATLVALLALVCGCGPIATGAPATIGGRARIVASATVMPAAGFRTQAIVSPYTADSVDRMKFELWQVHGGAESLLATRETPPGSGMGSTVDWSHLKAGTTYRLKAWALGSNGTNLNAGGDAATLDVTPGTDDALQATLAIQLADRIYDGTVHPIVTAGPGDAAKTDHLRMTLYERIGGSWVSQSVVSTPDGSGLTKTVDFTHLEMDTQYRIKAELIKTNGKVQDSKSVNFTTTDDDDIQLTIAI